MSQELSLSFSESIYDAEMEQEIYQRVGSQDIKVLLNTDLGEMTDYGNGRTIIHNETTLSLDDVKFFPFGIPQLAPLAATDILSNAEYPGPHCFEVLALPTPKSKNPWVYSACLEKVFIDMNQQFPVDFKVNNRPENEWLFIRITPQYSAQNYAGEPVCRCIQHDHQTDVTNKDIDEKTRQHVIRCSNKSAQYIGDSKNNERLSIVLPLAQPQVGSESVRELFHFVCKSSCPSPGMNRRAIEVIFTLENERGTILGRKSLNVRVCACPKRDKEKEENEFNKKGNVVPKGKKRKLEQPPPPTNPGKVVAHQDDFKVYTLNMEFVGKQNLTDILNYAEKVYMAKAYQLQGHPEEQIMRKTVAEVQLIKKQLQ